MWVRSGVAHIVDSEDPALLAKQAGDCARRVLRTLIQSAADSPLAAGAWKGVRVRRERERQCWAHRTHLTLPLRGAVPGLAGVFTRPAAVRWPSDRMLVCVCVQVLPSCSCWYAHPANRRRRTSCPNAHSSRTGEARLYVY